MIEPGIEDNEKPALEVLAMKAKEGDREARNALYFKLEEVITDSTLSARQLLGSLGDTVGYLDEEDISQQAFEIFCRLLDRWDSERKPLVPYITAMMHAKTVSYVRDRLHLRSKRRRLVPLRLQTDPAVLSSQPGPEEIVEGSEQWEELVAQLSDDWRRFVNLKFCEDLSSHQIARASHCSDRTVNRALRSALELLRYQIHEEWEVV
jgi:RNA polymerase sigma factor (sigma-70 family)